MKKGELRCIRAIQGHSGGMIISPRLVNYVMILLQIEAIYLSCGSSTRSILHCRNWTSGRRNVKKEDKKLFTPLDPFNSDADEAESITDTTKPRKVQYQIHWRPEQDAVYWIHLSTVEDAGLEFCTRVVMPLLRSSLCPKNASSRLSAKVGIVHETAHT